MKKVTPQTLKGFRDFLPEEELKRLYLINKIRKACELLGYDPLETPALEYGDTLLGKYGDEADMLLYTFKDRGNRLVGLRYDQTVPTCRLVAQNNLLLPFKRYQIQPVWRQEKPQKGRFREFLQVDADIFGSSTPLCDAEIVLLINNIYTELGFKEFTIKLNNREILFDLIKKINITEDLKFSFLRSVDKLEKIGKEGVGKELAAKGVEKTKIDHLFALLETMQEPAGQLKEVIETAIKIGVNKNNLKFDPTLVRGLDYYTGTIFEVSIVGYSAGSVLGGGRYDNLVKQFCGKDISGVGFGLGFDRTLEAMEQFGLLPTNKTVTKVLVTVFSQDLENKSLEILSLLRNNNINSEIYVDTLAKLDKQLKYANQKGIPFVAIIGPDEATKDLVTIKDLQTKEQKTLSFQKAVDFLK